MGKRIREENQSLTTYGCSAQYLNVLGQDITPASVWKHVVPIQIYFRTKQTRSLT